MDVTTTFRGLCKAKKSLNKLDGSANPRRGVPSAKRSVTPFIKSALEVVTVITNIRDQVLARKKDYLDPHSSLSDRDRNVIEMETLQRLQTCSDSLKGLRDDAQHNKTQIKTHRAEILRMVEAYLAAVSHQLTELQGVRVKRALDHAKLSKLETFGDKPKRKASADFGEPLRQKVAAQASTIDPDRGFRKGSRSDHTAAFEPPKPITPKQSEVFSNEELQLFEGENANLYNEMAGMEDEVRSIEHQMTEISKLQQIFTENVLIQEHQIDNVAATATAATENIIAGNIDIREAIQKSASFRAWILFSVLVLSFTLLFLHWYND